MDILRQRAVPSWLDTDVLAPLEEIRDLYFEALPCSYLAQKDQIFSFGHHFGQKSDVVDVDFWTRRQPSKCVSVFYGYSDSLWSSTDTKRTVCAFLCF